MRKFYKKKKRGPVQSKKIVYDNITFASGLERYMYMALKKAKIILNIKYTPDFVGRGFIIETKGRANESFPLRWKMFKKLVAENKIEPFVLYKPQNQKECDETIRLILKKQS